jgi:hypothetical protein
MVNREWYHAAQGIASPGPASESAFNSIEEENEDLLSQSDASPPPQSSPKPVSSDPDTLGAQKELRVYELLALVCCFIFPLLAAWLLHAIRSQLSRPSEGLVSNYNLTIFLLVAEIRPLSHLIKMIQRRILFLQRAVNIEALRDNAEDDRADLRDIATRIEELEIRVADGIDSKAITSQEPAESMVMRVSSQASSELKRSFQPEIDALSRAMRRYEKRSTISAVQHEARMQELETRLKDVVVLAAAAQRQVNQRSRNYITVLFNWMCALVVLPVEYLLVLLNLPVRLISSTLALPKRYLASLTSSKRRRDGKRLKVAKPQSQDREKRSRSSG